MCNPCVASGGQGTGGVDGVGYEGSGYDTGGGISGLENFAVGGVYGNSKVILGPGVSSAVVNEPPTVVANPNSAGHDAPVVPAAAPPVVHTKPDCKPPSLDETTVTRKSYAGMDDRVLMPIQPITFSFINNVSDLVQARPTGGVDGQRPRPRRGPVQP